MRKFLLIVSLLLLTHSVALAQWSQTSGPSLGHVNQFCRKGDTLYAAMGDYGIGSLIRSVDSGKTWKWLSNSIPNKLLVQSLAKDGHTLYAGTRNGLFTTTDEGASWRLSAPSVSVQRMAVFGGSVYYSDASNHGVMRSDDHGQTWFSTSTGLPNTSQIKVLYADGNKLYAGSNGDGLFETDDSAKSWHAIASEIPHSEAYIYSFARAGSVLFLSTPRTLYRSADNGLSWQLATSGLPDGNGADALGYNGTTVIAGIGGYGTYRSADLGLTWSKIIDTTMMTGATAITNYGKVFVIGALGLFRSADNASTCTHSDEGVGSTSITSVLATEFGVVAGNSDADFGHTWRSFDHGSTWMSIQKGMGPIGVTAMAQTSTALLAGMSGNGMYRSTDSGNSWIQASGFPVNGYVPCVAAKGNLAFAGTNGFSLSLFRSKDGGATWESAHNGLSTADVTSLLFDGDRVLVTISAEGIFSSSDQGDSWHALSSPSMFATLLGKFNKSLFAGDFNKLWRSDDGGQTWMADSISLSGSHPRSMTVSGSTIYIGTDKGLYRSVDSGRSYVQDGGADLSTFGVISLASRDGWIYAGTDGAGVWAKYVGELSVAGAERQWHSNPQVNPNPTQGSVTVSYVAHTNGVARIEIFDELGSVRKRISLGDQTSGVHSARLDLNQLPAGQYFCRIISGAEVSVAKIDLLR